MADSAPASAGADARRVALVTGGSSGIGQAVATTLARRGCCVVVVGRTPARLEQTLAQLEAASGPSASHLALNLDVASEADMEAMAARALERFGRIDILVASAGLGKRSDSDRLMPHPTARLPLEEWRAVLAVNLRGVFLANRAVLPAMRAQGAGDIVNVCSSTTPRGLRGTPFGPAYCASKFGVVGLSEALAAEVAAHGIRVQTIFPGPVTTPLIDQTQLARPFGGAISADAFADAVLALLDAPRDATLVHTHVLPFRGAFRAAAAAKPD
jgi:NAD(P)-dependent dehydrogenase (short-subunit alcohol dehydrogenase family)